MIVEWNEPRTEPFVESAAEPPAALDATGGASHTGHDGVDTAVRALGEVASLPPKDQVAEYERTHQALQETLGTIEER